MPSLRHYSRLVSTAVLLTGISFVAGELRAQAPGSDLNGAAILLSFTGQISVERGNYLWALNSGDPVEPQQVIVTGSDGYGLFRISDGSTFEVFPKSRVVFRENRGDWRDLLEIWLGKVRIQIEHPGGLQNNNKVRTPTAVISVKGTIFDVDVEDEDATTLVMAEEGQVEVRHLLRAGDAKILGPGEYIRVYRNEPLARKVIDKAGALQRVWRAASDAVYQAAVDAARNGGAIARTVPTSGGGLPADTKGGNPPPPPPPH